LTLAVGNTHLTCSVATDKRFRARQYCLPTAQVRGRSAAVLKKVRARFRLDRDWSVAVGGVVPEVERILLAALGNARTGALLYAERAEQLPLRIRPKPSSGVGRDRLLAAIAALGSYPGRRLLVIDCGTATTVNLVEREDVPKGREGKRKATGVLGTFQGGLIFPGEALALEALRRGTDGLPEVAAGPTVRAPLLVGRSTEQAMRNGVRHMLLATLTNIIDAHHREKSLEAVLLGGGGAKGLLPQLRAMLPRLSLDHAPDLVGEGLWVLWRGRREDGAVPGLLALDAVRGEWRS